MAIGQRDLDAMQQAYKQAVDKWVAAIREEEALASGNHNEAQIDRWEGAAFKENDLRTQARDAKKAYEGALRQEFFNF